MGHGAYYYVGGDVSKQRVAQAAEFLGRGPNATVFLRRFVFLIARLEQLTSRWVNSKPAGDTWNRPLALYEQDLESPALSLLPLRARRSAATALCYLCWALWQLGYVDQAADVLAARAVKHAESDWSAIRTR